MNNLSCIVSIVAADDGAKTSAEMALTVFFPTIQTAALRGLIPGVNISANEMPFGRWTTRMGATNLNLRHRHMSIYTFINMLGVNTGRKCWSSGA